MKAVIVLAMHGAPPNDFPKRELAEFFGLRARLEHAGGAELTTLESRYTELETKMRAWPRTAQNDPFYAGAQELAAQLSKSSGNEVIIGFNEFCAPSLDNALEQSVAGGAEKVMVITPMMTRGGEHSEKEIPAAIQQAQARHPQASIQYIWPFEIAEIAQFLVTQIQRIVDAG